MFRRIAYFSVAATGLAAACLALNGPGVASVQKRSKAGGPSFAAVEKIFVANKCTVCHGAQRPAGRINLTTYDTVIRGGEDGAILKAGDTDKSIILWALRHKPGIRPMPPMPRGGRRGPGGPGGPPPGGWRGPGGMGGPGGPGGPPPGFGGPGGPGGRPGFDPKFFASLKPMKEGEIKVIEAWIKNGAKPK